MILKGRMGNQFLTTGFFIGIFLIPIQPAWTQIEMMPPPVRVAPPKADPDSLDRDLEKLRNKRSKREGAKKSRNKWAAEKRKEELTKLANSRYDYKMMFQVSLLYPMISTKGPRNNYTTEITSHFSGYFRTAPKYHPNEFQSWAGFRLSPFSGTGTYEKTVGRYGYLYFGPMVGVGKISRPEGLFDSKAGTSEKRGSLKGFPVRDAWFLMAGIAALSRQGKTDPTDDFTSKDLDTTKAVKYDKPGLWVELTWAKIHYGMLGLQYNAGVLFGEGKTFYWFGVSMGGWH